MVSLHVEATSRCTLACPRCERTELSNKFNNFKVGDLDISAFDNFLDMDIDKINFCGNLGDPIYHRRFLDLVELAITKSKHINITTNGSKKNIGWWSSLNKLLRSSDSVTFSIDGTPDNFTQYRINGDWKSVLVGIKECVKGPAITEWKCIPFKFNENTLHEVEQLSNDLGIDHFLLDPSDRWIDNDPLKPDGYSSPRPTSLDTRQIQEQCGNNKMHFIGADGFYTPCCYSKHFKWYYKSNWWKNKHMHDIKLTKLSEQIRHFTEFYSTIQTERYNYCVYNCGKY